MSQRKRPMFEHLYFDNYDYDKVPLDRDIYLMDERWMRDYERALLAGFEGKEWESVGYVSFAAAKAISPTSISLSWFPNVFTRFHRMEITLPRDQFVACVGSWRYDHKPTIFVKKNWLRHLHLRSHAIFALIDVADFKNAMRDGTITKQKLLQLRTRIDELADAHPRMLFISFADTLLIKSNWHTGAYDSKKKYNYEPESFLQLFAKLKDIYREILDLGIYVILTQGNNEYYDDGLAHISDRQNHVSLNSLGVPFAQLIAIDEAAKRAIRAGLHKRAEVYMDKNFFFSLRFEHDFDRDGCVCNSYVEPIMKDEGTYYLASHQLIADSLRNDED